MRRRAGGVAVVVPLLGSPRSAAAALDAFRHGWTAVAAAALLASGAALLLSAAQRRT